MVFADPVGRVIRERPLRARIAQPSAHELAGDMAARKKSAPTPAKKPRVYTMSFRERVRPLRPEGREDFETFFARAPKMNPNVKLITGIVAAWS